MELRPAALVLLACAAPALTGYGEEPVATRVVTARRLAAAPPVIDGRLDEPAWDGAEWQGDFVQREPTDGAPPSQPTEFTVVYDNSALYFAFRVYDDPDQTSAILGRRDTFQGDWIEVNIDSHFDRRTAYSFTLSLSGTRGDEYVSGDGDSWSTTWDPVWDGAARLATWGWAAEFRIPLSQLRFSNEPDQLWGLQVNRRLFRAEERSSWQRIPKDSTGWVSRFGELRGLHDLKPGRRIELVPYAVASTERYQSEPGNPFRDGSDSELDGGLDGKIGLTSDLTLDLTINPDFGQVEADPSEVNLTAFETFFSERRPFFVEGNDILDLHIAPAVTGGDFTQDTLFYSRRIGRAPSHVREVPDGAHIDVPDTTTILGAFKLSGTTAGGLSVGLLDSVTACEQAAVDLAGERSHLTVEPLTNYFVGRLEQDFNYGDTQIGGMVTAVNRELEDDHLNGLLGEAYAGGVDFSTYFRDRDYRLQGVLLASHLRGSKQAIAAVQTSSARYFQRPDNESASFDPNRTSLGGHAGSVLFNRTSNHDLMFQTGVAWRSPGFEINDLGFMRNADQVNQFTWVGYRKRNPFGIFDNWSLNGNQWLDWDTAGNFLGARANINTNAQFRNKYYAYVSVTRASESISNTRLRGGPSSRWPGSWSYSADATSDTRKDLSVHLGARLERGDEDSWQTHEVWSTLTYRATDALRLSLSPSWGHTRQEMQYITTEAHEEEERHLFGRLDQDTLTLTFRVDLTITPDLTVQLYASPFLSTGTYREFKRITDPRAGRYRDRFAPFTGDQLAYDPDQGRYQVDENRDGTVDYGFADPDFDARDFNSNLVIRWEFRRGSTAYLVWSQQRANSALVAGDLDPADDLRTLFSTRPHDIILLKVSYWFSL